jgi:ABC-type transport system involved in multi-copper enzyme maturation permease subunit
MIGICRAELRKLTARPAIVVCAGLLLVGIVLLFYVLPDITFSSPGYHSSGGRSGAESRAQDLYPAAFLTRLVILFSVGAGMLALLVGTLSAGSEYGWDTLKTVYTQGPGRLPLFLGQVVAAALVLTAVLVLTAALAALSSLAVVTMDGRTPAWPAGIDVLKTLGGIWLVLVCYLAIGVALATLLRNPALAIGGALAYYLVFELALVHFVGILYGSGAGETLSEVLPGSSAHALLVSFMPFSPGDVVVIQDDHAIVVLMLWSVVCVAVSAALVWRRDVV